MRHRRFLLFAAALFAAIPTRAASHVTATLLTDAAAVRPGVPFTVAVRLTMEPSWHTYWKNPGDSGAPTSILWSLPPGWTAGPIQWPVPARIVADPLVSYGYERDVLLLTEITPGSAAAAGPITARVRWLECADVCIPGEATLTLALPGSPSTVPGGEAAAGTVSNARFLLPLPATDWRAEAFEQRRGLALVVTPPAGAAGAPPALSFFAADKGVIDYAAPQSVTRVKGGFAVVLAKADISTGPVAVLNGVLVNPAGWRGPGTETGWTVAVPVAAGWPVDASRPFGLMILFAFLGGLLLNLMPCVLPVLSLKVLGLVRAGGNRGARTAALFTTGVLVSFWTFAGALIALRAGGRQLGWGFQLQSPLFVAALAALFFVLALNLFGVFEIGASLSRAGGGRRHPVLGDLFDGALATAVATPCTAPFMGAALGFALAQPAAVALTVFTAMGVGMALPYALLALNPGWRRVLPKPGPWMDTFKAVMAFFLLATVLWLLWVFRLQKDADALLHLLIALYLLGMAAWAYGRWGTPARSRAVRWSAVAAALALAAAAGFWTVRHTRASSAADKSPGIAWAPFDPAQVAAARHEQRPVFVDFTASWCLTCQVNDRVVFGDAQVTALFRSRNVAAFKADWTSQDPVITSELQKLGRSGVPAYAYYAPGAVAPRLLPEVLRARDVLRALGDNAN
jgi:thiol:disulfide interchange protein DsbD